MTAVLTEIISLLVGGLTNIADGIGSGLTALVTKMFLETGTEGAITGLSTFGGMVAVFGGVALAIGLSKLVFNWVSRFGK